jgi:hypothetical protein
VTGPLPIVLAAYADACARAGMPDEARRVLGTAAATPGLLGPSLFAPAAFALGDSTEGAAWLERALARRCLWLPVLRVDPRLAPFRSEPRVRAVFDRIPSLREDADGAR